MPSNPPMDSQQFQALLSALQSRPDAFSWVQGAMALGAMLVSVTGVVVGMKSAVSALSAQLRVQGDDIKALTQEVKAMAMTLAVLKYASGIETAIPEHKE